MTVRDVAKTLTEDFVSAVTAEEAEDAAAITEIMEHMNQAYEELETNRAKVRSLQQEAALRYRQALDLEDGINKTYAERMAQLETNLRHYRLTKEHDHQVIQLPTAAAVRDVSSS